MLKVNGNRAKILKTEFKFSNYTLNGQEHGYVGFLSVSFEIQKKKGYFDFYVDNCWEKDITYFINKEYCCIPEDNADEINYLEVFDTNAFYDIGTFYNKMKVKFGEVEKNKIRVTIEIQEEIVSIEFNDFVEIMN